VWLNRTFCFSCLGVNWSGINGIVSQDLIRIKRPADGFIVKKISPRYNRIGFIFNFKVVFIFKFLNLYAQPASHVRAYASGRRTSQWASALWTSVLHIMSILTYTAKRLLPGTLFPLSSSCGPLCPDRAVLPGRGMPMSSSCGPTRALAHQDVRLLEDWAPTWDTGSAYKFINLNMKTTLCIFTMWTLCIKRRRHFMLISKM
jgi:hypothetical protein